MSKAGANLAPYGKTAWRDGLVPGVTHLPGKRFAIDAGVSHAVCK